MPRIKTGSWIKNFGRSVKYTGVQILTEIMPNTKETISIGKNAIKNMNETRKFFMGTKNKITILDKEIDKAAISKSVKTFLKNAAQSIKEGNLSTAHIKSPFDFDFDDGDFNFDDDDSGESRSFNFGDDDSEGEVFHNSMSNYSSPEFNSSGIGKAIVASASSNISAISNMTNTLANTEMNMGRFVAGKISTTNLITANLIQNTLVQSNSLLGSINENVGGIVSFLSQNVSPANQAMMDALQKIVDDIDTKTGLKVNKEENDEEKVTDAELFKNGFNIEAYLKKIRGSFKTGAELLGFAMTFGDLLAMKSGVSPFENPVPYLFKMGMKRLIPAGLGESLSALDAMIPRLAREGVERVSNALRTKFPFAGNLIASLFGITEPQLEEFSLSDYNRQSVNWDGSSKKALEEVIPSYLSEIAYNTSRSENAQRRYFDYDSGYFKTDEEIRQKFEDTIFKALASSRADVASRFGQLITDHLDFNGTDEENMQRKIELATILDTLANFNAISGRTNQVDVGSYSSVKEFFERGIAQYGIEQYDNGQYNPLYNPKLAAMFNEDRLNDLYTILGHMSTADMMAYKDLSFDDVLALNETIKDAINGSGGQTLKMIAAEGLFNPVYQAQMMLLNDRKLTDENAPRNAFFSNELFSNGEDKEDEFTEITTNGKVDAEKTKNAIMKKGKKIFGGIADFIFGGNEEKSDIAKTVDNFMESIDRFTFSGHLDPHDDIRRNVKDYEMRSAILRQQQLDAINGMRETTSEVASDVEEASNSLVGEADEVKRQSLNNGATSDAMDVIVGSTDAVLNTGKAAMEQMAENTRITSNAISEGNKNLVESFLKPTYKSVFGKNGLIERVENNEKVKEVKEGLSKFFFGKAGEDRVYRDGLLSDFANSFMDSADYLRYIMTGKGYTNREGATFEDNPDSIFPRMGKFFGGWKDNVLKYIFGDKFTENEIYQKTFGAIGKFFRSIKGKISSTVDEITDKKKSDVEGADDGYEPEGTNANTETVNTILGDKLVIDSDTTARLTPREKRLLEERLKRLSENEKLVDDPNGYGFYDNEGKFHQVKSNAETFFDGSATYSSKFWMIDNKTHALLPRINKETGGIDTNAFISGIGFTGDTSKLYLKDRFKDEPTFMPKVASRGQYKNVYREFLGMPDEEADAAFNSYMEKYDISKIEGEGFFDSQGIFHKDNNERVFYDGKNLYSKTFWMIDPTSRVLVPRARDGNITEASFTKKWGFWGKESNFSNLAMFEKFANNEDMINTEALRNNDYYMQKYNDLIKNEKLQLLNSKNIARMKEYKAKSLNNAMASTDTQSGGGSDSDKSDDEEPPADLSESGIREARNSLVGTADEINETPSEFERDVKTESLIQRVYRDTKTKLGEGIQSVSARFERLLFGNKDELEDDELVQRILREQKKSTFTKNAATVGLSAIAGGVLAAGTGGHLGLIGSLFLPGGPIGGAILGTGLGILATNERFKAFLFGEKDDDGKRIGGVISKSTQEAFKKSLPVMVGGATLGAMKSLLGLGTLPGPIGFIYDALLPGGPIGGAMLGMATSLLFRSKSFTNFLFGKEDENGRRRGSLLSSIYNRVKYGDKIFKDKAVLNALGSGVKGALLGGISSTVIGQMGFLGGALTLGGPVGGAIAGLGLGIASSSEKFRNYLFGEMQFDENGKPIGRAKDGLISRFTNFLKIEVVDRLKETSLNAIVSASKFVNKEIVVPFKQAFNPIVDSFRNFKDDFIAIIKDGIKNIGTRIVDIFKDILEPVGKQVFNLVFKPLGKFTKTALKWPAIVTGKLAAAPLQLISMMLAPRRWSNMFKAGALFKFNQFKQGKVISALNPFTGWGDNAAQSDEYNDDIGRNKTEWEAFRDQWLDRHNINKAPYQYENFRHMNRFYDDRIKERKNDSAVRKRLREFAREDQYNESVVWTKDEFNRRKNKLRKNVFGRGLDDDIIDSIKTADDLKRAIYHYDSWIKEPEERAKAEEDARLIKEQEELVKKQQQQLADNSDTLVENSEKQVKLLQSLANGINSLIHGEVDISNLFKREIQEQDADGNIITYYKKLNAKDDSERTIKNVKDSEGNIIFDGKGKTPEEYKAFLDELYGRTTEEENVTETSSNLIGSAINSSKKEQSILDQLDAQLPEFERKKREEMKNSDTSAVNSLVDGAMGKGSITITGGSFNISNANFILNGAGGDVLKNLETLGLNLQTTNDIVTQTANDIRRVSEFNPIGEVATPYEAIREASNNLTGNAEEYEQKVRQAQEEDAKERTPDEVEDDKAMAESVRQGVEQAEEAKEERDKKKEEKEKRDEREAKETEESQKGSYKNKRKRKSEFTGLSDEGYIESNYHKGKLFRNLDKIEDKVANFNPLSALGSLFGKVGNGLIDSIFQLGIPALATMAISSIFNDQHDPFAILKWIGDKAVGIGSSLMRTIPKSTIGVYDDLIGNVDDDNSRTDRDASIIYNTRLDESLRTFGIKNSSKFLQKKLGVFGLKPNLKAGIGGIGQILSAPFSLFGVDTSAGFKRGWSNEITKRSTTKMLKMNPAAADMLASRSATAARTLAMGKNQKNAINAVMTRLNNFDFSALKDGEAAYIDALGRDVTASEKELAKLVKNGTVIKVTNKDATYMGKKIIGEDLTKAITGGGSTWTRGSNIFANELQAAYTNNYNEALKMLEKDALKAGTVLDESLVHKTAAEVTKRSMTNSMGFTSDIADSIFTNAMKTTDEIAVVGAKEASKAMTTVTGEVIERNAIKATAHVAENETVRGVAKILQYIKKPFSKLGEMIGKVFGGAVTGKKVVKVVENGIEKVLTKPSIMKAFGAKIRNCAVSLAAGAAKIIPIIGWVITGYSLIGGLATGLTSQEAAHLFGISQEDVAKDIKLNAVSGILKMILETLSLPMLFDLLSEIISAATGGELNLKQWLAVMIYNTISSEEERLRLSQAQANFEYSRQEYNRLHGTNLSRDAFNDKVNQTINIWNPFENKNDKIDSNAPILRSVYDVNTESAYAKYVARLAARNGNIQNDYVAPYYRDNREAVELTGDPYAEAPTVENSGLFLDNEWIQGSNYNIGFGDDDKEFKSCYNDHDDYSIGYGDGIRHISQYDPSIRNASFGKRNDGSVSNIARGGCGPVALAMAASAATSKSYNPVAIANLANRKGYTSNGGSTADLFNKGAKQLGITTSRIGKENIETSLKKGKPVVLSGKSKNKGTAYSGVGHIVTATGIDNRGNVLLHDPRRRSATVTSLKNLKTGFTHGWSVGSGRSIGYGADETETIKVTAQLNFDKRKNLKDSTFITNVSSSKLGSRVINVFNDTLSKVPSFNKTVFNTYGNKFTNLRNSFISFISRIISYNDTYLADISTVISSSEKLLNAFLMSKSKKITTTRYIVNSDEEIASLYAIRKNRVNENMRIVVRFLSEIMSMPFSDKLLISLLAKYDKVFDWDSLSNLAITLYESISDASDIQGLLKWQKEFETLLQDEQEDYDEIRTIYKKSELEVLINNSKNGVAIGYGVDKVDDADEYEAGLIYDPKQDALNAKRDSDKAKGINTDNLSYKVDNFITNNRPFISDYVEKHLSGAGNKDTITDLIENKARNALSNKDYKGWVNGRALDDNVINNFELYGIDEVNTNKYAFPESLVLQRRGYVKDPYHNLLFGLDENGNRIYRDIKTGNWPVDVPIDVGSGWVVFNDKSKTSMMLEGWNTKGMATEFNENSFWSTVPLLTNENGLFSKSLNDVKRAISDSNDEASLARAWSHGKDQQFIHGRMVPLPDVSKINSIEAYKSAIQPYIPYDKEREFNSLVPSPAYKNKIDKIYKESVLNHAIKGEDGTEYAFLPYTMKEWLSNPEGQTAFLHKDITNRSSAEIIKANNDLYDSEEMFDLGDFGHFIAYDSFVDESNQLQLKDLHGPDFQGRLRYVLRHNRQNIGPLFTEYEKFITSLKDYDNYSGNTDKIITHLDEFIIRNISDNFPKILSKAADYYRKAPSNLDSHIAKADYVVNKLIGDGVDRTLAQAAGEYIKHFGVSYTIDKDGNILATGSLTSKLYQDKDKEYTYTHNDSNALNFLEDGLYKYLNLPLPTTTDEEGNVIEDTTVHEVDFRNASAIFNANEPAWADYPLFKETESRTEGPTIQDEGVLSTFGAAMTSLTGQEFRPDMLFDMSLDNTGKSPFALNNGEINIDNLADYAKNVATTDMSSNFSLDISKLSTGNGSAGYRTEESDIIRDYISNRFPVVFNAKNNSLYPKGSLLVTGYSEDDETGNNVLVNDPDEAKTSIMNINDLMSSAESIFGFKLIDNVVGDSMGLESAYDKFEKINEDRNARYTAIPRFKPDEEKSGSIFDILLNMFSEVIYAGLYNKKYTRVYGENGRYIGATHGLFSDLFGILTPDFLKNNATESDADKTTRITRETYENTDLGRRGDAVYKYLKYMGFGDVLASAIVANMQKESAILANNLEDAAEAVINMSDNSYTEKYSSTEAKDEFINDSFGYGLLSDYWKTPGLKEQLFANTILNSKELSDPESQLNFLIEDIKKNPELFRRLGSNDSPSEVAALFYKEYEGGTDGDEAYIRGQLALNWDKVFVGGGTYDMKQKNALTVIPEDEDIEANKNRSFIGPNQEINYSMLNEDGSYTMTTKDGDNIKLTLPSSSTIKNPTAKDASQKAEKIKVDLLKSINNGKSIDELYKESSLSSLLSALDPRSIISAFKTPTTEDALQKTREIKTSLLRSINSGKSIDELFEGSIGRLMNLIPLPQFGSSSNIEESIGYGDDMPFDDYDDADYYDNDLTLGYGDNQTQDLIEYLNSQVGKSSFIHGRTGQSMQSKDRCQAFAATAYMRAGINPTYTSLNNAYEARDAWGLGMVPYTNGKYDTSQLPVGSTLYAGAKNSGSAFDHVAIYTGNGEVIEAGTDTITKHPIEEMWVQAKAGHKLVWGYNGGTKPSGTYSTSGKSNEGSFDSSGSTTKTVTVPVVTNDDSNAAKTYAYLVKTGGFSPTAALAIMGSLKQESQFQPSAVNKEYLRKKTTYTDPAKYIADVNSGAYPLNKFDHDHVATGLAQWMWDGRKGGLYKATIGRGSTIDDFYYQLDHLVSTFKPVMPANFNTMDLKTAAAQYFRAYESGGSADATEEARRYKFAQELAGKYLNAQIKDGSVTITTNSDGTPLDSNSSTTTSGEAANSQSTDLILSSLGYNSENTEILKTNPGSNLATASDKAVKDYIANKNKKLTNTSSLKRASSNSNSIGYGDDVLVDTNESTTTSNSNLMFYSNTSTSKPNSLVDTLLDTADKFTNGFVSKIATASSIDWPDEMTQNFFYTKYKKSTMLPYIAEPKNEIDSAINKIYDFYMKYRWMDDYRDVYNEITGKNINAKQFFEEDLASINTQEGSINTDYGDYTYDEIKNNIGLLTNASKVNIPLTNEDSLLINTLHTPIANKLQQNSSLFGDNLMQYMSGGPTATMPDESYKLNLLAYLFGRKPADASKKTTNGIVYNYMTKLRTLNDVTTDKTFTDVLTSNKEYSGKDILRFTETDMSKLNTRPVDNRAFMKRYIMPSAIDETKNTFNEESKVEAVQNAIQTTNEVATIERANNGPLTADQLAEKYGSFNGINNNASVNTMLDMIRDSSNTMSNIVYSDDRTKFLQAGYFDDLANFSSIDSTEANSNGTSTTSTTGSKIASKGSLALPVPDDAYFTDEGHRVNGVTALYGFPSYKWNDQVDGQSWGGDVLCGYKALADSVTGLTGQIVTPRDIKTMNNNQHNFTVFDMNKLLPNLGVKTDPTGSISGLGVPMPIHVGSDKRGKAYNKDIVKKYLDAGYVLVTSGVGNNGSAPFGGEGHYVEIHNYTKDSNGGIDKVLINNNGALNTSGPYDAEKIASEAYSLLPLTVDNGNIPTSKHGQFPSRWVNGVMSTVDRNASEDTSGLNIGSGDPNQKIDNDPFAMAIDDLGYGSEAYTKLAEYEQRKSAKENQIRMLETEDEIGYGDASAEEEFDGLADPYVNKINKMVDRSFRRGDNPIGFGNIIRETADDVNNVNNETIINFTKAIQNSSGSKTQEIKVDVNNDGVESRLDNLANILKSFVEAVMTSKDSSTNNDNSTNITNNNFTTNNNQSYVNAGRNSVFNSATSDRNIEDILRQKHDGILKGFRLANLTT